MFSAFGHHRHLGLLSERAQMIQFFIQPTHTLPGSRLAEQLQPLLSLFLLIDGRTGCPDSVRAIDSVPIIVSKTTLPSASRTATTVVAWCRSHPIYLSHFIERPLLCSTPLR